MEREISPVDLIERAFRHSGKSEYDKLPLKQVIKIILEALAGELY